MATMLDRGDSYKVQYLGSVMLSQMATGLGLIQKPLRDLYFHYRQASARVPVTLPERHLMMTDRGMVMTYPEPQRDGSSSQGNVAQAEEFYVMTSILSWDAVQFVTVKASGKKVSAAFEPLDNDHSRNKDNLFTSLDKQHHFLHGQRHPPMFTCVLRRTQGVKALDVHAFVCYSDEEALGLVRALNTVHASYTSGEQQETGVFGYNPFGKESVRSTAGLQRAFSQQRQAGGSVRGDQQQEDPETQHQFILRRPGDNVQELQTRGNATPVSAHKHSRAKSPGRSHSKDRSRYTGSQPNLSTPPRQVAGSTRTQGPGPDPSPEPTSRPSDRGYVLAQSDFQLNNLGREEEHTPDEVSKENPAAHRQSSVSKKSPQTPETYDYLQTINRTFERAHGYDRQNKTSSAGGQRKTGYNSAPSSTDNTLKDGDINFIGAGIFQQDSNFGKGSTRSAKNMGQGYSLLSSSQGPPPGYAPHQSTRQPYAPSPTQLEDRSPSPTYQSTIPRNRDKQPKSGSSTPGVSRNPSVAQAYENINRFVAERSAPEKTPGGYPQPVVPHHSPMLGKSDSLRQVNKSAAQRAAPTTTQGTVMAQVTPQAQRGPSIGPFANRQSPGFGERERNFVASSPNLKNSDTPPSSLSQASIHSKPVAMVPPHKIQGIKVLPTQHSLPKQQTSPERSSSFRADPGMLRSKSPDMFSSRPSSIFKEDSVGSPIRKAKSQYFPESKKIESSPSPSGDIYAMPRKGSQKSSKSKHKSKAESQSHWQFQKPSPTKPEQGSRSQDPKDPDKPQNEHLLVNQKKDAEIASVVQNMHFDYEGTMSAHAPHRTNFEKSLGYFP